MGTYAVEPEDDRTIVEPEDDRTIVVTFCTRNPIGVYELGDFFTRFLHENFQNYITSGRVIDSIRMQSVRQGERPLYACIVFDYAFYVACVLSGQESWQKYLIFNIGGLPVSVRKYDRSLEEFNMFHNIDRRLFARLIYDMSCDRAEAELVVAWWMLLEKKKSREFKNMVTKALNLTDTKLRAMVATTSRFALNCRWLNGYLFCTDMQIPPLQTITQSSINGSEIQTILENVCSKAFEDIVDCQPWNLWKGEELQMNLKNLKLNNVGHNDEEERTLFLTFSKGYPISESEIREYFTNNFGDNIIDRISMQDVGKSNEQPLCAQLVLRSESWIQVVLGGKRKVQFTINGKHIRAKKSEPKSPKGSQPSSA